MADYERDYYLDRRHAAIIRVKLKAPEGSLERAYNEGYIQALKDTFIAHRKEDYKTHKVIEEVQKLDG